MKRQGQASNSSGLGRIAPCRIQIRQGATIVQSQEDDGAECQSWSNRATKKGSHSEPFFKVLLAESWGFEPQMPFWGILA